MKRSLHTRSKILLTLVGVGVLVVSFWLGQQKKSVGYEGVVVDSATGQPVPNAKVILSTWDYGFWDSNPTHVGTLSDDAGRFTIAATPGYWIDNVDLSASSPESRFRRLRNPSERTDIRIELSNLDSSMIGIDGFTYDKFSGGWSGKVQWIKNNENKSVDSTR
ncbi:carboxypeptidase-like regulatory domain-containing protein [Haloferula chungangensis]|uniref:Carboxypeptidase-like regulatory domain-containing protein n=1 Tax=Haloferula chungangensis TaxID=1048331 RepID=A0ABW2LCP3_9BACT